MGDIVWIFSLLKDKSYTRTVPTLSIGLSWRKVMIILIQIAKLCETCIPI